jgi:hypothetical protein
MKQHLGRAVLVKKLYSFPYFLIEEVGQKEKSSEQGQDTADHYIKKIRQ